MRVAIPPWMTAPRRIIPGTTYLVTRRCAGRQFLLRPSRKTNDIFSYVLAVAAARFGIRVHAFCVMSNHFHLVVTDTSARLPEFEQYLDSLVARAINASLGRWESFWAPSSYSAVTLATPHDVVEKTAYVLANPVSAGLVRRGSDWPGLWSAPEHLEGGVISVIRPSTFFAPDGPMPALAELRLERPPGFVSAGEFRDRVGSALAAAENGARLDAASRGRGFLGVARVLAQSAFARPRPTEPHQMLRPRIAARDKWKRVEALSRLVDFLSRYRAAREARRAGERDAVFPAGTYLLRVAHQVPCAPF
jgi:REP element-mobilizing transposase RayT